MKKMNEMSIETPLGSLLAIADEKHLYLLAFTDWCGLTGEIERLKKETQAVISPGETAPLASIKRELKQYFNKGLKPFKTPLRGLGTPFQEEVWATLKEIPYGSTRSYMDIAQCLGKPTAYRAVANANGKNRFVIVIPCHRVINHNGALGGYSAGLERKKWLIHHETGE